MHVATQRLLAQTMRGAQAGAGQSRLQVRRAGNGPFRSGSVESTLARLKPETRDRIARLDLSHAPPRDLTAITLGLYWEGEIALEGEDTIPGMGFDSGYDTPFNVMKELNKHLCFLRTDRSGFDWSDSIAIYEKGMQLAIGLQDMIRTLHPERTIDTFA